MKKQLFAAALVVAAISFTGCKPTGGEGDGKITGIQLKADEKLLIKELPTGTRYAVEEKTIPTGYTKTSPIGNAEDTITTGTKTAAFVNTYDAKITTTFSGKKKMSSLAKKRHEGNLNAYS